MSSFQDKLKPLLAGQNAADLWPALNFVILSWALLVFVPRWKWTPTLTLIVPLFHAFLYVAGLVSLQMSADPELVIDFNSLRGVVAMFRDPNVVFIGWVHYIVFDCLVGRMIVLDSMERGASMTFHLVAVVPCLVGTLLAGPTGWLLYMILRQVFLSSSGSDKIKEPQESSPIKAKTF
jgi:hypothetical protein